jgi:hypothetical protein
MNQIKDTIRHFVSFIAQHFDVELDVYDTSVERFNRIEDIAASIVRKRAGAGRPPQDPVP